MGSFSHSLDEKGRLIIPSKYREELGREFVVSKGYDTCLYAYSNAEWQKFYDEIMQLPDTSAKNRRRKRYFMVNSANVEMDRQGRVLIPAEIRALADINGDILIAGLGNKLEIWNRDLWNATNGREQMEAEGREIAGESDDDDGEL